MLGTVRYFKPEFGFGVIYCRELKASFKFKAKYSPNLPSTLRRNQRVQFETYTAPDNQQYAINVIPSPEIGPDSFPCPAISLLSAPIDTVATLPLYTALFKIVKTDLPFSLFYTTPDCLDILFSDEILKDEEAEEIIKTLKSKDSPIKPHSFIHLKNRYYKVFEVITLKKEREDF